jgi:hypothetical protein
VLDIVRPDEPPDQRGAAAPGVGGGDGVDRAQVEQAVGMSGLERLLQGAARHGLGQVGEGAGGRGDRDGVTERPFDPTAGAVDADPCARPHPAGEGNGDVEARRGVAPQPPEVRGGAVAEHGVWAAGADCREVARRPGEDRPHEIDAGIETPETAGGDAAGDGILVEAERAELGDVDDAVLAGGERREQRVPARCVC